MISAFFYPYNSLKIIGKYSCEKYKMANFMICSFQ